jgi:hypothetical protein
LAEVELRFKYEQVGGPLVGPSTIWGVWKWDVFAPKRRQKNGENDDKPPNYLQTTILKDPQVFYGMDNKPYFSNK